MADALRKSHLTCHPGESRGPELPMSQNSEEGPSGHSPACTLFEDCLAPLCPLDRNSLKGVWYPDEEICRSRTQGNRPWIRAQRKIAGSRATADRYFTLAMLNRNCIVKKGITGLDPNELEEPQLRRWFTDHPVKREMSVREKRAKAAHLKRFRFRDGEKRDAKGGLGSDF